MSCTIELLKSKFTEETLKSFEEMNNERKTIKFNYTQLTGNDKGLDALRDLTNADKGIVDAAVDTISKMIAGRKDITDKLPVLLKNMIGERDVLSKLNPDGKKTGREILEASIALRHIMGALESENDVVKKWNLDMDSKDVQGLLGTTSAARLNIVIGKEISESLGYFPEGSMYSNSMNYAEIGQIAIDNLANDKNPLIVIDPNGKWITGDIRTTKNKQYAGKNGKVTTGRTIRLEGFSELEHTDMNRVLKELAKLTSYTREGVPVSEAVGVVWKYNHYKMDNSTKKTIGNVQKGKFKLSDSVTSVMDDLLKIYESKGRNEQTFRKSIISKYKMGGNEILEKIFGLTVVDQSDSIFAASDRGREISKLNPLISLMQHYETLGKDEFYYTYFMAGNSRLFLNETVLQFQGDKHMSRHILEAANKTNYSGSDLVKLIRRVSVNYGIPISVIDGSYLDDDGFDSDSRTEAIELALVIDTADSPNTMDVLAMLAKDDGVTGIDSDKVWEQYKAISVIRDIRAGLENDSVDTGYLSESDATASGIIIKMYQNLYRTRVQEVINGMGFGMNPEELSAAIDNGEIINDAYALALAKMEELVDEVKAKMDKMIETGKKTKVSEESIRAKMNLGEGSNVEKASAMMEIMDMSARNLIKFPIMRFSYRQAPENNKRIFGREIAEIAIRSGSDMVNKLNKIFGIDKQYEGKLSKEDQTEIIQTLPKKVAESVGSLLVDTILKDVYDNEMFGEAEDTISDIMDEIYKLPLLKEDNFVTAKIMGPLHKVNYLTSTNDSPFNYEESSKFRLSLDKRVETVIDHMENGDPIIVKMTQENETSAHVLPIHMMDAAILIRAIARVHKELGEGKSADKFKKLLEDNPMMLIHDAVNMPPKYAHMIEAAYEKEITIVNYHYDVAQELYNEYEYKANKSGVAISETMKKLKIEIDERVKVKQEFLSNGYNPDTGEFSNDWSAILPGSFKTDLSDRAVNEVESDWQQDGTTEGGSDRSEVEVTKPVEEAEDTKSKEEVAADLKELKEEIDNIPFASDRTTEGGLSSLGLEMQKKIKDMVSEITDLKIVYKKDGRFLYQPKKGKESAHIEIPLNVIGSMDPRIFSANEITDESILELVAHEIEHHVIDSYIMSQDGQNSLEVKRIKEYIKGNIIPKVKEYFGEHYADIEQDGIANMSDEELVKFRQKVLAGKTEKDAIERFDTYMRMAYASGARSSQNKNMNRNVKEIVAIMRNEKTFSDNILKEMFTLAWLKKLSNEIRKLYKNAFKDRNKVNGYIKKMDGGDTKLEGFLEAVELVNHNAKLYKMKGYKSGNRLDVSGASDKTGETTGETDKKTEGTEDKASKKEREEKEIDALPGIKYKGAVRDDSSLDIITQYTTSANDYVSRIIDSGLGNETVGKAVGEKMAVVDTWAIDNIPMYENTVDILSDTWKTNKHVKQVRNYVSGSSFLDKKLLKLNNIAHKVHQDMIQTLDDTGKHLSDELAKHYKKDEMHELNKVFAKSGFFGIVNNGMAVRIANGEKIQDLIKEQEEVVRSLKMNLAEDPIEIAIAMAKMYVNNDVEGSVVNTNLEMYQVQRDRSDGAYEKMEALIALQGLAFTSGSEKIIVDSKNHKTKSPTGKDTTVFDAMSGLAMSIKAMDVKIHNIEHNEAKDLNVSRGNLIDDLPSKSYQMLSVSDKTIDQYLSIEGSGWEILKSPTREGELGIIYRENTRAMQDGMGINIGYIKTGIPVDDIHLNDRRIMRSNGFMLSRSKDNVQQYNLVLNSEQKEKLGYYSDPVKSMIRAYAHKQAILETQIIRTTMLSKFTSGFKSVGEMEIDITDEMIEKDEHPVFINMPDDFNMDSYKANVSDRIKQEYVMVDNSILSDVGGFKGNVKMVRKDVQFKVSGFKEGNLFKAHKYNKIHKDVKEVIRYLKTNLIILNAPKIAFDLTSGVTLAMAKGAGFVEVYKYAKEAVKFSREMTMLRNKELQLRYDISAGHAGKGAEAELEALNKEIAEHPFSPALANGMIQSLGVEMLTRDLESTQGLQVSMDELFKKLTGEDKKKLNKFNAALKSMQKLGGDKIQMEYVFQALADQLNNTEHGKAPGEIIDRMAKNMKEIKTEESAVRYLGELFAAPNSSLVKLGGAMTIYADLIPRWIMYRHNINTGMSEIDAMSDAIESLPNYVIGMPESMKFFSDLYVTPFPSFYTRIQRVILALAHKSPVSFATHMLANELFGGQTNITGSNIFSKMMNGSIFSAPTELDFIPYENLFDF